MKVNYSITAGVYILSTINSACVVDAVSQVSAGKNPLIAVSVNKENYTNIKMLENDRFCLAVLAKDTPKNIISTFGFNSSKDTDKFTNVSYKEIEGIKVIDDSIGYMMLEKVNVVDCDTHTLFIGRLISEERYNEKEELVYQDYQKHKEEYVEVKVTEEKIVYVCSVCGYVYDKGEIPDDFVCPLCGMPKSCFVKKGGN